MCNFDELKDFLETIDPDDYEIRLDALTLAIKQREPSSYHEGATTVLVTAREFYEFLKNG